MKKRIFRSICAIALGSLVLLSACVVLLVYRKSTDDGWKMLTGDATYIVAGIQAGGEEYLTGIKGYPGRITLIDPNGTVLYDDSENPAAMDNHADRPEVAAALQDGAGHAERKSDTLNARTLYYAVRLDNGNVLRLSLQADNIAAEAVRFVPWLLAVALLLIVAAALTARWQTRRILAPINALDLDEPFNADAYDELSPLLRKIALQRQQIDEQVGRLRLQQQEFAAITSSMAEGLIVVDKDGRALTVNQSARRILDIDVLPDQPLPLLALSRNLVLDETAKYTMGGSRTERVLELDGRQYRLVGSPTLYGQNAQGAVLLLIDDTERLQAEQTRREFSANVSHELKTPLTSISGYAEIIRDGLVKPQDIPDFAGKIYDESSRLIALISDIIKLSRLDEKQPATQREPVELLELAQDIVKSLEQPAREKDIQVVVTGGPVTVFGVRSILSEILYNLVENAIRYNKQGGRVEMRLGRKGDDISVRVKDTGMGIPAEHQPHVFERFYRVDKSHARTSGGTGLGLSIVKRGALFHNGSVELHSQVGRGSTFTVLLDGTPPGHSET